MRKVVCVSTSRADYSSFRPLLRATHADVELELVVSGSHLSERYGLTVNEIEADHIPIAARVPIDLDDGPLGVASAIGAAIPGFAAAFEQLEPDLVMVLGDRYEMFAACQGAFAVRIPVAHLHGGELTLGAIDDSFRHAMTKLSHLHLVATETYGRRVIQLGEEAWRVKVTGAPSLDEIRQTEPLSLTELAAALDMPLETPPIVVTYHPVTVPSEADDDASEVFAALADLTDPIIVTAPNADPGNEAIRQTIDGFVRSDPSARSFENLGPLLYASLLANALVMVGNSSSGLIEAPMFSLPVVNVGPRQQGRIRGANVLDVPAERSAIASAIDAARSEAFRSGLADAVSPYGDGRATGRILQALADAPDRERLLMKGFVDAPEVAG